METKFMDDENFSITQYGKPLDESLYTIDTKKKIFITPANALMLDFNLLSGWTFTTGSGCTFETYSNCKFNTGKNCTFHTLNGCKFYTGKNCIFHTTDFCTFTTGPYCTFQTNDYCNFDTGSLCTFLIRDIKTCKFETFDGNSTVLDRKDKQRYVLDENFPNMMKMLKG